MGVATLRQSTLRFYEARKYANWLTAEAGGTTFAYSTDGTETLADHATLATSGELVYVIPSDDEWYKAAYYDGENSSYSLYSTGSNSTPSTADFNYGNSYIADSPHNIGFSVLEQNGTQDMMGNVFEWTDDLDVGSNDSQIGHIRGGAYFMDEESLSSSKLWFGPAEAFDGFVGFRVAAIPEPGSVALLGLFGGGILFIRRIFMM